MNDNSDLLCKLLIVWCQNEFKGIKIDDEEFHNESFIYKVLSKKLDAVGLEGLVYIPDEMYMMCEILSDGNPGYSQLILHKVLENRLRVDRITSLDFGKAYPHSFPDVSNEEEADKMYVEWNKQKLSNGGNACDTIEWWIEAYKAGKWKFNE